MGDNLRLRIDEIEFKNSCTLVWVTIEGDQRTVFAFADERATPITRATIEQKAREWYANVRAHAKRVEPIEGLVGAEWVAGYPDDNGIEQGDPPERF